MLPWKIGLTLDIKGIGTLQLLLQDILRTDSLLLFLTSEYTRCMFILTIRINLTYLLSNIEPFYY